MAAVSASSAIAAAPATSETGQLASLEGKLCCVCNSPAKSRCGRCFIALYCGPACQTKHWKKHRKTCGSPDSSAPTASAQSAKERCIPLCGADFQRWLSTYGFSNVGLEYIETPLVGLKNPENNCYLNAVLQCLIHTPLFSKNLKAACTDVREEWLSELLQLLHHVEEARKTKAPVSASRIACLIAKHKEFGRGQQADAHEAFMFILSNLLQGCLKVGDGSHINLHESTTYQGKESLEKGSLVGHIFGMDLGQSVSCGYCDYISTSQRVEYCLCISVSLGLSEGELRRLKLSGGKDHTGAPETDIDNLLKEYTKNERVPDFKCEKCERKGCSRQAYFTRRPNILLVYIDRRLDGGLFGKINRHVQFSPRLNIAPYLHTADNDDGEAVCYYSLYAIVVHKDVAQSTNFGHYIAYIRDKRGQWFLLDDTRVEAVSWNDVRKQNVYMLLYAADRRVQPIVVESSATAPSVVNRSDALPDVSAAPGEVNIAAEPAAPVRAPGAHDSMEVTPLDSVVDQLKNCKNTAEPLLSTQAMLEGVKPAHDPSDPLRASKAQGCIEAAQLVSEDPSSNDLERAELAQRSTEKPNMATAEDYSPLESTPQLAGTQSDSSSWVPTAIDGLFDFDDLDDVQGLPSG